MTRKETGPVASGDVAAAAAGLSLARAEQDAGERETPRIAGAAPGAPPPSEGLGLMDGSEWEVVGHDDDDLYSDHRGSVRGDRTSGRGCRHAGSDGGLSSSAAAAVGREAWREQAVGRGEISMMSGGRTLDYSSQV